MLTKNKIKEKIIGKTKHYYVCINDFEILATTKKELYKSLIAYININFKNE